MNRVLLQNSLLVAASTTLLAGGLGLAVALWLFGLSAGARRLVLAGAVAALALPPFLVTNCWLHYLGVTGPWRAWLPWNLCSPAGAVWLLALLLWPITTFAAWSAWRRLEAPQLEAEPAARGFALVRHVLLPLGRNALALAALLTFVLALNNFTIPALLQVKVLPAEMWIQFNTHLDPLAGLRAAWPLVVLPAWLLGGLWLARGPVAWPHVAGGAPAGLCRRQLGRGWFLGCGAAGLALLALSVGLPVFQLAAAPRTWVEFPAALAAGQGAAWNAVLFSAAAATGCVALGLAGWRMPIGAALWLPLLVPGVLLGLALIACFNRPPWLEFYRGAGIVLLAWVLRYVGPAWNGVAHALRATDRDLSDAARLEGASPWQRLWLVQWPQIAPQAAVAWYVVYLLCLWDVETLVLIVPPGGETLALRVFNLLHYGHNAQVNALCLTLLALALAPLALWSVAGFARRALRCARQRAWAAGLQGCAAGLATLLLAGCGEPTSATRAPLDSRFFERAEVLGGRGTAPGQFSKPRSLAVDRDDQLYVADMTGRVQKLAPDGRYWLSWQMPQTDLGKAKGMCRDRAGNIVVLEPHYQRVNHFAPDGRLVAQWGERGTNAGQLAFPRAVAVLKGGDVLVSEYSVVERVQRFRVVTGATKAPARVEFLGGFGRPGTGPGEFNRPEGLAVDAQDRVYVADSCNHRIQVFTADGQFLRAFGRPGSGAGELSYPYDVVVDAAGRVIVCEFGNSRLQVFGADGRPLEVIGGPGAAPGRFANPWSLVFDSHGDLYVADSLNHRVQRLVKRASVAAGQEGGRTTGTEMGRRGYGEPRAGRGVDAASAPKGPRLGAGSRVSANADRSGLGPAPPRSAGPVPLTSRTSSAALRPTGTRASSRRRLPDQSSPPPTPPSLPRIAAARAA